MAVYENDASLASPLVSGTKRKPFVGSHFAASSMAAASVVAGILVGSYHKLTFRPSGRDNRFYAPHRDGRSRAAVGARDRERLVALQRGQDRPGHHERQPVRDARGRNRRGSRALQAPRLPRALPAELLRSSARRHFDQGQGPHQIASLV